MSTSESWKLDKLSDILSLPVYTVLQKSRLRNDQLRSTGMLNSASSPKVLHCKLADDYRTEIVSAV